MNINEDIQNKPYFKSTSLNKYKKLFLKLTIQ